MRPWSCLVFKVLDAQKTVLTEILLCFFCQEKQSPTAFCSGKGMGTTQETKVKSSSPRHSQSTEKQVYARQGDKNRTTRAPKVGHEGRSTAGEYKNYERQGDKQTHAAKSCGRSATSCGRSTNCLLRHKRETTERYGENEKETEHIMRSNVALPGDKWEPARKGTSDKSHVDKNKITRPKVWTGSYWNPRATATPPKRQARKRQARRQKQSHLAWRQEGIQAGRNQRSCDPQHPEHIGKPMGNKKKTASTANAHGQYKLKTNKNAKTSGRFITRVSDSYCTLN